MLKYCALKYICVVFLLCGLASAYGQLKVFKLDSLKQQLKKDSVLIYKPKRVFPLVAMDQRNSFLKTSGNSSTAINIWGAKGGITLYDRHNLGIGAYSIQNSSKHTRIRDGAQINQTLTFEFATAFYEYSFVETRWWEIGVPIEAGFGFYKTVSTNASTNAFIAQRRGQVFPLGTALDVYFKPTPWFGINVMGGYRYVLNNPSRLDLNGWFYSVGGAVYIRQIYRDSKYYLKKRHYKEEVKKINLLPD
ncbi:MAG TPA: hypothetical protein VNY73_07085 [Bacteroidia bacterium]|nr:hypothetical protein [Bacteroidia bacterium]